MSFINDRFLLHTEAAERLFVEFAKNEPILDYHNHLPPNEIAENRRFENLSDIWIAGDHYKWRALRANGISEELITGDASPKSKFLAWAATVPKTLRNPLYHWTHLELSRYFGINELLDETNADSVWDRANEQLTDYRLSVHGILEEFKVAALCTTDDPADPLNYHEQIAASDLKTKVYPAFRPDKAFGLANPTAYNAWLNKLGGTSGIEINSVKDLLDAIEKRHNDFHAIGCRLSDHGMPHCYADFPTEAEANAIFTKVRGGFIPEPKEQEQFASYLMLFFGCLDAAKGWTKQLHIGPVRNVRSAAFEKLGPDVGLDSIGDELQVENLGKYLDRLDRNNALPKTIVYNNNPVWNYSFATMVGNFQDGSVPGKMQFGAGWWYLDTKEGIEWQLNTLSNTGLLSRFVGMLTDSRSFMSFTRHEYFRRVLCNLLGKEMERGELPKDFSLIGNMVRDICYQNAHDYLGLEVA